MGMIIQPSRFTPPAGAGSVVLLIGAEGSDGSTTIIDESPVGRTLTANGACAIETTGALVGTSSLAINQANESTGYLNCGASADWNFGTGDFTIEGRAKSNFNHAADWRLIVGNYNGPDDGWALAVTDDPNNYLVFMVHGTGGYVQLSATTGDVNTTAFHFAASRNGSTLRLFKDGAMVGKSTSFGMNIGNSFDLLRVGDFGGVGLAAWRWRGLIDELRVTKGLGRYNSDSSFTPSTPYPR